MNTYIPFSLFDDLQRDVGRFLDQRAAPASSRTSTAVPAVDIVEQDHAYFLTMDVPGVSGDSIDVTVHSGVLTVSGERKSSFGDDKIAVNERWQGQFVRRFSLPDSVDQAQIEAKAENGVLALRIPKQAAETPRKITVQ